MGGVGCVHPQSRSRLVCLAIGAGVLLGVILVPIIIVSSRGGNKADEDAGLSDLERVLGAWSADCPRDSPSPAERADCHPEPGATPSRCTERGCCWRPDRVPMKGRAPLCIFPRNYGYVAKPEDEVRLFSGGWELKLSRLGMPFRYGDDIRQVNLRVETQTPTRLRIKVYDPSEPRFEAPEPAIPVEKAPQNAAGDSTRGRMYAVSYNRSSTPFTLQVRRTDTDTVIFDTSLGALMLGTQYSQLSTRLPSRYVFGLGEHAHRRFRHDLGWRSWPMMAKDSLPDEMVNGPGVHPMYLCLEDDGRAHVVLLHNSHPMEVQLQPTPGVTFRTVGGILDFYLFLGPTPAEALQQYAQAVGRPPMPPYWALGFQVGRSGFRGTHHVMQIVDEMANHSLPVDVVGLGSDFVQEGFDFTPDSHRYPDFPTLVSMLHSRGQHLVLSLEPTITVPKARGIYPPYEEGKKAGVFINDSWGMNPLVGKGRGGLVVYPDFGNTDATRWWSRQLTKLFQNAPFDGLWLDENEPSNQVNGSVNGCLKDHFNRPPFVPRMKGSNLFDWSLCMDATHSWEKHKYLHLEVHNLYGHNMLKTTARVLSSVVKRRFLLASRSTYAGSGKYGGHWFPKYSAKWNHMLWSIAAMLEFNMFGIPYVGADICGNSGEPDTDLCTRWVQLGAFYPLARIFHPVGEADVLWSNDVLVHVAQRAFHTRYNLIPYLYTLFYHAHTMGSPVVRPLFYEFSQDNRTYGVERQFMWGSSLIVTPILDKGARTVKAYLPAGPWYDFYNGQQVISFGEWMILDALLERINLHVRGGSILPIQPLLNVTAYGRHNPMHLLVALDENHSAKGALYWDDGESRDAHKLKEYVITSFQVINDTLIVIGQKGRPTLRTNFSLVKFTSVDVMGLPRPPSRVTIGDLQLLDGRQVDWDARHQVLKIKDIIIPITDTLEIQWHWS